MTVEEKLTLHSHIDFLKIATEIQTPVYVYNKDLIIDRYKKLRENLPEYVEILYAMKANENPYIVGLLRDLGAGVDTISLGEMKLATLLNIKPEKILFTGVGVSSEELEFAIENGITVNVGSFSLLKTIKENFPRENISIRINPDVGSGHHRHVVTGGQKSKFGIHLNSLNELVEKIKDWGMNLKGLHMHIGSGILDPKAYLKPLEVMKEVVKVFASNKLFVEFVDIGGGLGVPYKPEDNPFDIKAFANYVEKFYDGIKPYLGEVKIYIEPGRFLVAESGVLLGKVLETKENPGELKIAILDTGFNHLIRPAMYGSYHAVTNLSKFGKTTRKERWVIAGNICESGDVFTVKGYEEIDSREIEPIEVGDIIGILDAGAYGFSMASHYNLRPLPPEVLVENNGNIKIIRKRQDIEEVIMYGVPL